MKISENNNVFMELTNPVHGGEGWELGEVLWSPVASAWNIMKEIQVGDIILHSVSKNNIPHELVGISIVKRAASIVDHEPLKPGKWAKYDKYYRIELQDFSAFQNTLPQKDFFDTYHSEIIALKDQQSFYALSSDKREITGAAQKYMALIPNKVQELLMNWFSSKKINLFDNVAVSNDNDNTQLGNEGKKPGRVKTTTERIIRDTAMIKELKKDYHNVCQICGKAIKIPNGKLYSEGHHLQKLGGVHEGPDVRGNVIVVCPYHHAEFDYGSIAINPKTMLIEHIDKSNAYHGKKLAYSRTDLESKYIKYHYKKLFNKD